MYWDLTWKLGWDHDKVVCVTGVFAAATRVPGALQKASSIRWGSKGLLQLWHRWRCGHNLCLFCSCGIAGNVCVRKVSRY